MELGKEPRARRMKRHTEDADETMQANEYKCGRSRRRRSEQERRDKRNIGGQRNEETRVEKSEEKHEVEE